MQPLNAPVTEIVTFFFADPPPDGFLEKVGDSRSVSSHHPGFVEVSLGVNFGDEVNFQGMSSHAVIALVGWETKEPLERVQDSGALREWNPCVGLPTESEVRRHMRVVKLHPGECLTPAGS